MRHLSGALFSLMVLLAVYAFVAYCIAGGVAHAAGPGDGDGRPCVAGSEWKATAVRGTMQQIEAGWEVHGLGHVVSTHSGDTEVLKQYPSCGPGPGFVQVMYEKNLSGRYMARAFARWVYGR